MNNKYIEDLRKKVKAALKDDNMRFRHSIGVADTSACLAMRYGVDIERAYIAGLLHDCAKCIPDTEKIRVCQENKIPISDIEMKSPYLLHSKLGAYYAKHFFKIEDEEICSSIEFHTTGKPDMTMLECIVFLSDYIEPYRNTAPDLDMIRDLAFKDIKMAIYKVLEHTIDYLTNSNKPIDTTTIETFEFYRDLQ